MFKEIPVLALIADRLFIGVLIILAIFIALTFWRMVKGPNVSDRLLAANVMGGLAIVAISLLGIILQETYLLDIAMVYALISFLAVIVLSQIYIGVYRERNSKGEREDKKS